MNKFYNDHIIMC